jgi:hypothetical protein
VSPSPEILPHFSEDLVHPDRPVLLVVIHNEGPGHLEALGLHFWWEYAKPQADGHGGVTDAKGFSLRCGEVGAGIPLLPGHSRKFYVLQSDMPKIESVAVSLSTENYRIQVFSNGVEIEPYPVPGAAIDAALKHCPASS